MPGPPLPHAFISYVHEDAEPVSQLASALWAADIRVWKDTENLWPGEDWQQKIREAIEDGSLAFIACFSTRSVRKARTYMNAELNTAVEQIRLMTPGQVWLLPVRLDDCELPYFDLGGNRTLHSLQRIDLFGPEREANLERLVAAVGKIFGTPSTTLSRVHGRRSRHRRARRRRHLVIASACAVAAAAGITTGIALAAPSHTTPLSKPPTGTLTTTLPPDPNAAPIVGSMEFEPGTATVAVPLDNGNVTLWNTTAQKHSTLSAPAPTDSVATNTAISAAFGPDDTVAVGYLSGDIYLWNTSTSKRTTLPVPAAVAHDGQAVSMAFEPGTTTLAVGYATGNVYLWNTSTRKHTTLAGVHGPPIAFEPGTTTLAVLDSSGTGVDLWDITTKTQVSLPLPAALVNQALNSNGLLGGANTPGVGVNSVAFGPVDTLAVGYTTGNVFVWNIKTRTYVPLPAPHGSRGVDALAYGPDGTLAVGDGNGNVYLWDIATKTDTVLHARGAKQTRSLAFDPRGTTLATSDYNDGVLLWNITPR